MEPLLIELKKNLTDSSIPLVDLLRKSLILAKQQQANEIEQWIRLELNGYPPDEGDWDKARYRIFKGIPKALKPGAGWIPIQAPQEDMKILEIELIKNPINEIEKMAKDTSGGPSLYFPIVDWLQAKAEQLTGRHEKIYIQINRANLSNVLEAVRNKLLDWVLEMESSAKTANEKDDTQPTEPINTSLDGDLRLFLEKKFLFDFNYLQMYINNSPEQVELRKKLTYNPDNFDEDPFFYYINPLSFEACEFQTLLDTIGDLRMEDILGIPQQINLNNFICIVIKDPDRLKYDYENQLDEFVSDSWHPSNTTKNFYAYEVQKKLLLNYLGELKNRFKKNNLNFNFLEFNVPPTWDKTSVHILRTLLAIEKEGFLEIKRLIANGKDTFSEILIKVKFIHTERTQTNSTQPPTNNDMTLTTPSAISKTLKEQPKPFKNLQWESITLQFINGHDVKIWAKDIKPIKCGFKEMGFEDKRSNNPNQQWEFLKELANHDGAIGWDSSQATPELKKRKQKLAETLSAYFGIEDDPFYAYKDEKNYRLKLVLKPEE